MLKTESGAGLTRLRQAFKDISQDQPKVCHSVALFMALEGLEGAGSSSSSSASAAAEPHIETHIEQEERQDPEEEVRGQLPQRSNQKGIYQLPRTTRVRVFLQILHVCILPHECLVAQ
jgi:hypothetical protein